MYQSVSHSRTDVRGFQNKGDMMPETAMDRPTTQQELADACGVSRTTVMRWMKRDDWTYGQKGPWSMDIIRSEFEPMKARTSGLTTPVQGPPEKPDDTQTVDPPEQPDDTQKDPDTPDEPEAEAPAEYEWITVRVPVFTGPLTGYDGRDGLHIDGRLKSDEGEALQRVLRAQEAILKEQQQTRVPLFSVTYTTSMRSVMQRIFDAFHERHAGAKQP